MDIQTIVKNLHPLEVRVVRRYRRGEELTIEKIEAELGFKAGNGNQALSWLGGKGLVSELRREPSVSYELTELGRSWKEKGIPEERLLALVREKGALTLPEIAGALGIENKDIGSAFGSLSKIGLLAMDSAKRVALAAAADVAASLADPKHPAFRLSVLRALLSRSASAEGGLLDEAALSEAEKLAMAGVAKKRGAADAAFRIVERETVVYGFAAERDEVAAALEAAGITGDEIGTLTPEMLATGAWKGASFRAYNVEVPPTRLLVGRSNPYAKFLEDVKDKLVSLGFEEFDGSLVETEFWNSDALFMPQFHSARDIHDVYHVAQPNKAKSIEEPWLSRVAATHEDGGETGSRGWNYSFDREFTKRLILRSQGTVLSARQLPTAKIPGKYFGIARCFRYDRVDATHLSDFYQTEGIVLGEEVNLRTLLGFLEMFAIEVAGAKEVKYVPGYFPFTEPSVEVHIKHPVLGWFELGGSGIFRPEVTKALGIDVPVAAWGIGIDRMALMALGLNDLRELFSNDIENVRLRRAKDR
ncbi:MAG: phenylalanine--tRNA ligase subunit alpha [Treponema sp. GWB1_62_6]|nr:MAG: phenylalanine--tRNA ligase subunit alpha [Treponema sp. GWA1_62_8]OHE68083.1 MAG: phenylalanine--tRNA ligase subunit alpha [Treponema sp. GWB1_62_6]OHE68635.1 MAG: phenylalanine--tRNA ligase subunit alpha [Treponema sp. GWC1_61_84]HCM26586.1 phenylalanine--tRNA ligase subunit alpha [Treponema sp.]